MTRTSNKGRASLETMGQKQATKLDKQAEQGATQTGWLQARKCKASRVSDSTIKSRHPAGQRDGTEIAEDNHATNDVRASCDDGISSLVQVANAATASKDGTCGGTDSMTTPAPAPKRTKKSGINKRQASPIPGQGEELHVNNEPDDTPRWAYKEPDGGKCLLGSKCLASSRDQPCRKHPW